MSLRMRLTRFALIAAGGLALLAPTVTDAHAAFDRSPVGTSVGTSCSGAKTTYNYPSGAPFKLEVYYSTSSGGTNCVKLINNSGKTTSMRVKLEVPANNYAYAQDTGSYRYYAGAVRVHNTSGKCINVWSDVTHNGRYYKLDLVQAHCGR